MASLSGPMSFWEVLRIMQQVYMEVYYVVSGAMKSVMYAHAILISYRL